MRSYIAAVANSFDIRLIELRRIKRTIYAKLHQSPLAGLCRV